MVRPRRAPAPVAVTATGRAGLRTSAPRKGGGPLYAQGYQEMEGNMFNTKPGEYESEGWEVIT